MWNPRNLRIAIAICELRHLPGNIRFQVVGDARHKQVLLSLLYDGCFAQRVSKEDILL